MRELDDAALELQLRRVLTEHLGSLALDITVDRLASAAQVQRLQEARPRSRLVCARACCGADQRPVSWLAAGALPPRQKDATVVVTLPSLTVLPTTASPEHVECPADQAARIPGCVRTDGHPTRPSRTVRLADGRVLGIGDSWPERKQQVLWDPITGRVSPAGLSVGKRSQPIGVLLQDGRVLILGGDIDPVRSSATYSTAEIYDDPARGTFAAAGVGKV